MRKQLDPRIPILVNNNVTKNHRSFVVLVGDKGRDQIVNLHFLLSQARVSARPSVLWCYKKDLGFTTHRKKREAKIKRDVKRGIREPNDQDPFEIFVTVTDIRYTYYKESHKILGHTYGMLVLQDFEALTPNLLARTVETVEGGGLIVLLLKSMNSLRQLYTMGMDVHARYRTESSGEVKPRFNERFILSLAACPDCLFLDDELNVLPLSKGKDIEPLPEQNGKGTTRNQENAELRELKNSLEGSVPAGPLVALAKTTDQARALLTFVNSLITPSDPSSSSNHSTSLSSALNTTTTLLAARGRGKSSALGLALAAAVHTGYANIFLTSPAPENLQTAWEFLFKGLDALGWEEHLDYDILQATHDLSLFGNGKPIVRVNIFRNPTHRQTIQYIDPRDAHVLGQAELLIIDEAAAIPLPVVRNLLGPAMAKGSASAGGYAVWLASTVNGYEGTGRSLSLKLIQQLRDNSSSGPPTKGDSGKGNSSNGNRTLNEVKLSTPIRYAPGDEVEKWLNTLLCLDVSSSSAPSSFSTLPHPTMCTLYHINRDTLFSFHPASEAFLQRIMSLYVASHYKNQPNDLQLMSDAPGHELYVLLPPIDAEDKEEADILPHPLAVIQIAFEGRISRESVLSSLSRGLRAGGDLIPWLITQQYQETKFAELSGARIVRVAVGEGIGGMGYGSRAIKCLNAYFSGEYFNLDESETENNAETNARNDAREAGDAKKATLHTEKITVRAPNVMPPLLQRLSERRPKQLDYLGVSYGLTGSLLRFWKRLSFVPLYIRHTPSDLTGEHTCVMVRGLNSTTDVEMEWLGEFGADFRTRLLTLLSFPKFRDFGSVLGLSVLEAINNNTSIKAVDTRELQGGVKALLPSLLTPFDLKRLESYGNNQLDYHVILDLLPLVATLFFQRRLNRPKSSEASGEVNHLSLSAVQSAILLGMGLQRKTVEEIETELSLPVSQILAMLVKLILKITKRIKDVQKEGITQSMRDHSTAVPLPSNDGPAESEGEAWKNVSATVEAELEAAGAEEKNAMKKRERQREMINSLDLRRYAIDSSIDWSTAETQVTKIAGTVGKKSLQTVVSVKSGAGSKRKASDETGDNGEGGVKKLTRRGKKAKR
ncbi:GNAT acetyltransferase 2-domain-containing protein [Lentinula lateritia]|nr:GNAT acetyltransferase 2-domain-containing protein [Lentinula lateritia]